MNREDIIKMAQWAYDHEYGSITLQSGERCDDIFVDYMVDLIRDIKAIGDGSLGITMCVGDKAKRRTAACVKPVRAVIYCALKQQIKNYTTRFTLKMNCTPLKRALNAYVVCAV